MLQRWNRSSAPRPQQSGREKLKLFAPLADSRCNLRKNSDIYELLGDVRVASPRLCDLGRTIGDLGRTTGRLRGFSARFPRTGHELDSHSKKIRCSRAAPTLDHTLAALLKANPTSLAASNTVPRVSRPN